MSWSSPFETFNAPASYPHVNDSDCQLLVHGETSIDTGITKGEDQEASPRFQARMAGIFAWISTTEGFALLVRSRLVVDSDATATAHNILAHELLYRSAIVSDVIAYVVSIPYTLLLYNLFRPVSRRLSLVAAVLSLVGLSIHLCICVFLLAPLVVLGGAQSLSAVNVGQSQALALTFLNLHDDGYAVGMVLFGFYNILIGYLIFRSTFCLAF